jgi:hypothetical protein
LLFLLGAIIELYYDYAKIRFVSGMAQWSGAVGWQ